LRKKRGTVAYDSTPSKISSHEFALLHVMNARADAIVILRPSWTRDNRPFVSSDETSVMAATAVMSLPDDPVGRFTRRREPCFHRHFPEEWI